MAINFGVGPHNVWLTVNGAVLPCEDADVSLEATKKSGTFSAKIPMSYPGVRATLGPTLGDNTASITVSTRGAQATLITGEIDSVDYDYIARMISVSGRDASAKLQASKSAEKFQNQQPGQIISTIAGRVGLSATVDPLAIKAGKIVEIDWAKMTDNVSYGHVLHQLAEFMGAYWYVSGNKLIVKSTASTAQPYVVNFKDAGGVVVSDALSLRIKRNVQAGKPIAVKVNSWNSRKKTAYSGSYTVGGNGTTQTYNYHLPGLTQDHANQHAKAKAKDHSRHEIEVSLELVGDPSIDISQPLQLIGTDFAQTFKIDSISHKMGMNGHRMQISAKSAAQGRS